MGVIIPALHFLDSGNSPVTDPLFYEMVIILNQ